MAVEVTFRLEVFEGPLDLLLSLLSKNKVDIIDIPIALILEQYLDYLSQMREFDMEIASEFITMAAQLMYIKSRTLLPAEQEDEPDDPRAALIEALIEYQQFKEISGVLGEMNEIGRDIFTKLPEVLEKDGIHEPVFGNVGQLVQAIEDIFQRAQAKMPPPASSFRGIVERQSFSLQDKLAQLIGLFKTNDEIDFEGLVLSSQSRSEIVALFLAVLELSRGHKIIITDKPSAGYVLKLAVPGEDWGMGEYSSEVEDGN